MGEIVNLPDGSEAEIPDGMSDEQFRAIIAKQFPPGTPVVAPPAQAPAPTPQPEKGALRTLGEEAVGLLDTGVVIGSGLAGEVVGGITGLAKTITSGPEAGEDVQKAFTGAIAQTPRSEKGERNLRVIGDVLDPVIKGFEATRKFLGDTVHDLTGSAGMATAFSMIPDVALEVVGAKSILRAGKASKKNLGKIRTEAKKIQAKEAVGLDKDLLIQEAPTPREIFDLADSVYKEVDNFGVTVKPESYGFFADSIEKFRSQIDPELNPQMSRLMDLIAEKRGQTLSVSDIDDLRKKTVTALAGSVKSPSDKRIASIVQKSIDDLIADSDGLIVPDAVKGSDVNLRLLTARKLWGRGRRAETVDIELKKAMESDNPLQATKTAFTRLLKEDVVKKQFTEAEKTVLRNFVKPGGGVNILRLMGNFGFDLATPGSLGNKIALFAEGGGAVSGAVGSGTVAGLAVGGTISKALAKRIMSKRGDFANALFGAGRDAGAITKTYLKNVPKGKRQSGDLTALLLDASPESLAKLAKSKGKFLKESVQKAREIVESRQRAGAIATPAPFIGAESEQDPRLSLSLTEAQ